MCAHYFVDDTSFSNEGGGLVNRGLASVLPQATLANHTNDLTNYDDNNDYTVHNADSVMTAMPLIPNADRSFDPGSNNVGELTLPGSAIEESNLVVDREDIALVNLNQVREESIQCDSNHHDGESFQCSTAASSSSAAAVDTSAGPPDGASRSLPVAATPEVGADEKKARKAALSAKYKGRRRWKAVADPYGTSTKPEQPIAGFFANNAKHTASGIVGPQYESPGIVTSFVEANLVDVFRADVPMSAPSSSQGDAADDPIVVDVPDGTSIISPIVVDVPDGTNTIGPIVISDNNTTLTSAAVPSSRSVDPLRAHTTREGGISKKTKVAKKATNIDSSTVHDLITVDGDVPSQSPSQPGPITTQINRRDDMRLGNAPTSPNNAESMMVDEATPPVRTSSPDLPQGSQARGNLQKGPLVRRVSFLVSETFLIVNPQNVRVAPTSNPHTHGDETNGTRAANVSCDASNTQPPSKKDSKGKGKQKAQRQQGPLLSDEELRQDKQRIPKGRTVS